MKQETEIKVDDELMELINEYFPKGDKRRGEVLVINSMALIKGFQQGRKGK